MLSSKQLQDIGEADIQALITAGYSENRIIEYKAALPGSTDSDKKEFLYDVSSFANASGGDLIYGMAANSGVPIGIAALSISDIDKEKLRLESILRMGIRPRVPGLAIHPVVTSMGTVIIIRVPRSWASPHMVVYQDTSKFYSRNSAGKYPLDIDEIRSAFLLSETISERIRNFRINRIANIIANETPVPLENEPKLILHVIPYNAFSSGVRYDVISLGNNQGNLRPIGAKGWNSRYNFDGIVSYASFPNKSTSYSYLQIFHNGVIEAVDIHVSSIRDHVRYLYHNNERELLNSFPTFIAILKQMGIQAPLFLLLSLVDVKGCRIEKIPNMGLWYVDDHPIDRNELIIPEILVDSFDVDFATYMQPAFDMMWNAAGFPKSIFHMRLGA